MIAFNARRITFARLLLEIRRRAASHGEPLKTGTFRDTLRALREVAAERETPESAAVRQILGAMLRAQSKAELDGSTLNALTPATVLRLDAVLAALVDGGITEDELRVVLRQALIHPVS
jgi:hypothetical protein